MKGKIYVNGSKGMVGKNMVQYLKDVGYSNLIYNDYEELDLTKREDVFDFFEKERPDFVIHLASVLGGMGDKIDNPVKYLRDNLLINTNVIDACAKFKVKKLINLSSACIYPTNASQPTSEEDFKYGPLESVNEGYALSKIAGLKLCIYYNKEKNTEFITLVAPNLYGLYDHYGDQGHVIPSMIYKFHKAKTLGDQKIKIWGTGKEKREFLFAEDLAKIIFFAINTINKEDLVGGILNCGLGNEIFVKEIAFLIKDIVGFQGEIKFDTAKPSGMNRRALDSSKFLELTNFENKINFREGLEKIYNFFKNNVA